MTTHTLEHQDLHQAIDVLSDAARERLAHYVAFLRYEDWLEDQEDAEDVAYIKSLTPEDYENAVPLEEVKARFRASECHTV
jgi:hypothetical protein